MIKSFQIIKNLEKENIIFFLKEFLYQNLYYLDVRDPKHHEMNKHRINKMRHLYICIVITF